MPSPHRISHDLYRGPKRITDPGNGGTIRANADLQVCELTTGASDETRVLANPTKPGIRFTVRLLTDGGGIATVTAENGLNAALETTAIFADAGDVLEMISVSLTATTYRWEALVRPGVAFPTATGTATSTATATSTQSISGSDTASGTFSASRTATSTRTATATATGTQ